MKQPEPLLSTESSGGRYLGPGGQDILPTPDGDLIFFHGWNELFMYRGMHSAPLEWNGKRAVRAASSQARPRTRRPLLTNGASSPDPEEGVIDEDIP